MFLYALLVGAALIQSPGPWQDPRQLLGQVWKVEGTVEDTRNTGDVCYLNFSRDWNTDFNAVIFARDFVRFPANPELYYRGKAMEITGPVGIYRGKPEIFLIDPGQIRIIEAPVPAPPAPAAAARPKPALPAGAAPAPATAVPRKAAVYEGVGVSRNLAKVAGEGAMVILGDGSRWQIFPADRKVTVEWQSNEGVVVEKLTKPLDNYSYVLVNMGRWQQAIAVYMGTR